MKSIVFALALFVCTSAFATSNSNKPDNNTNTNLQGQHQTATGGIGIGGNGFGGAGGAGGQGVGYGGNAAAGASASNQGVSTNVSVNNNTPDSLRTVGNAPDVIAYPTAPCRISVSASAGWLGGAFGFGSSVLDESCRRIEVSRQLHNLGQRDAAVSVMCNEPEAAKALGAAICPQPKQEPVVTVTY